MALSFGEQLKQYRNIKGLTLRDVENKTKISNGYINQLESGYVKNPSPHYLYKLAELYQVSYEAMMVLAGYLVRDKKNEGKKIPRVALSLMKNLSPDEEEKLIEYLEFIRVKNRKK